MDTADLSRLLLPIRLLDHAHGPEDAPYTLVEYGDYECPDCGRLYVILRDLQRDIASRLRTVFRHYPRSGVHRHAQQAAEAVEAAGVQGKFWEMHTPTFRATRGSSDKRFDSLRGGANLGCRAVPSGVEERNAPRESLADFRAGVQNGVYGTPGLFLNSVRYDGEWDKESLRSHLNLISRDGS